jgi:hypothetical protein
MKLAFCFVLALAGCAHHDSTTTITSAPITRPAPSSSPRVEPSRLPFDLPQELMRDHKR